MKDLYEEIFSFIVTSVTVITSIAIVLTFLTTYNFILLPAFSTYFPLQISISICMLLWGVRFYFKKIGRKKYFYSLAFLLISIVSLIFMLMSVR
ncbi:hypothetical protein [Clostridium isatidis]|uniref:Uncharacterized protein n=1 Tax=Clostridium isatidis TaxID=182773 RepID=A0A343J9Y2_9CLOT|nr:hypothetical protein BEN51_02210 [Clostridium isatidis]